MKNWLLLAALSVGLSTTASALSVTYGTTGVINCTNVAGSLSGCGTTSISFGNLGVAGQFATISFAGIGSSTVTTNGGTPDFTFGSFGHIFLSCAGCASNVSLPAGVTLSITINQTLPGAGNGSIPAGSIQGALSGSSSSAFIQWPANNTISIVTATNTVTYGIANNPLGLVSPTTNGGDTTIQGIITNAGVPEPGTYALMGFGLLALGALRRTRQL